MRRGFTAAALMGASRLLFVLQPIGQLPRGDWWRWVCSDPERALLLAVQLAGWLLAIWLLVVTLLSLLGTTRTAAGRAAGLMARRLTPVAVRRVLEAALGVAVAVGPAGPALASPTPAPTGSVTLAPLPPVPAPIVAPPEQPLPDLDRPQATTAPAPTATPAPALTARPTPALTARPTPTPTPAPLQPSPPVASPPPRVVQPGDTLWGIAAGELPPSATPSQITALWQRWYAVNRQTIGPDPALLFPGELLRGPAAS